MATCQNSTSSPLRARLDAVKVPQTKVVLSAVEDTLKDQHTEPTSTAYFAVLLALLGQSISSSAGIVNKDLATSVVYLLDLVAPFVPAALMRARSAQILTGLSPAVTHPEAEAPLLRPALGCLESLLLAQDATAWSLSPTQIGPRRGLAAILNVAVDHRPKVRKRALDALMKVLTNPPPTPSLHHPAADLCADTALARLSDLVTVSGNGRKHRHQDQSHLGPAWIHTLQLVKTVASASGGWPSKNIEPLCVALLNPSRSSHEYLTIATFEVFETIFEGMADHLFSANLPRLLSAIAELRPSGNDAHLLPPWIAVLSRAYEVAAQVDPNRTFHQLPVIVRQLSDYLASSSSSSSSSSLVRASAAEGLVSLLANAVPDWSKSESSAEDDRVFQQLAESVGSLLTVKYQAAWMEVLTVLAASFHAFRSRSTPLLSPIVKMVGDLRSLESFQGKKQADDVLGSAIAIMGPEAVLQILPLNLVDASPDQTGRAWMLPILRDHVSHTDLAHFRSDFVPLSAVIFQRIIDTAGTDGHTMETKIYETVVRQIWAILPGYCTLPRDLVRVFDQSFAEQLANILYKQIDLRADVCKALQVLIESNQAILATEADAEPLLPPEPGVTVADARRNLDHLATFAKNFLAVLFNVFSETFPQSRGFVLTCIDAFLSITPEQELMTTLEKVVALLESSLVEPNGSVKATKGHQGKDNKMPPMSHTFMALVATMAPYLPRESFGALFDVASALLPRQDDPQLQKKAYQLVSRLARSETGRTALRERSQELGELMLGSAEKLSTPARKDRLAAIAQVVEFTPRENLHFVPSILSEIVISLKEANEKARTAAFDLLVRMGEKMERGGTVKNSLVPGLPQDAPDVPASLEEYFTMVSAGLTGSTPHVISASITALTRLLYHFRGSLPDKLVAELVSTLDLFLTSKNREIVRSVLGFVKVCVISLPPSIMLPRLETLVPNVMSWSHEHKARFKAKVKHILERMIRRFGVEMVERYCPTSDRKLIANIRKTRDRRKRKRDEDDNDVRKEENGEDDDMEEERNGQKKRRFESEYDQALYGSDDGESDSSSDDDNDLLGRERWDNNNKKQKKNRAGGSTFIIEDGDDDDPLDLLDPKSLAKISTTRPSHRVASVRNRTMKAKTNADGKLIIDGDDDGHHGGSDAMMTDVNPTTGGNSGRGSGGHQPSPNVGHGNGAVMNAYMEALKGKDTVQRGQRGRLKFNSSQKRRSGGDGVVSGQDEGEDDVNDDDKMMDFDEKPARTIGSSSTNHQRTAATTTTNDGGKANGNLNGNLNGNRKVTTPRGGRSGRGGIHRVKQQRRGLDAMMSGGGGGANNESRDGHGGRARGRGRGGSTTDGGGVNGFNQKGNDGRVRKISSTGRTFERRAR